MKTGRVLAAVCVVLTGIAARAGQDSNSRPPAARAALFLLDSQHLARTREQLRQNDPRLRPALDALEADAKKALAMKPVSVMDKPVTPPSGDKHDYMSQAPYWWPDKTKPNGRPYIRKDGERNPEINGISDHDNLGRLCSTVATLGLAFHFTGREEYASHATRLVRTWFLDGATRMNPHLRFGQGIPGINDGRGIGIIETRGLPELLDGVRLMTGSSAWTAADESGLQEWMRAYVRWLVESPYGQEESRNGNNHETWYDVQAASLALYTSQEDLARRTLEHSRERIGKQFEPDGRQPRELERTRSWDYSAFNLTAFFHLATLGQRVGVDLWDYHTADGRSLRRGLDFMVPYATGDRKWPEAQITEWRPGEIHWLLRRAAVVWKEPKYRALSDAIGGGRARLNLLVP
jgi:Alginate lyase